MDAKQFDTLARSLSTTGSRRGALAATLVGVLAPLAIAGTEAKKKKKPCPPCKTRKKGKCKGTLPDGSPCAGSPCKTCQGGACVNLVDDTACNGDGRCLAGSCNPPPDCTPYAFLCFGDRVCCSGACEATPLGPGCLTQGTEGGRCTRANDCQSNQCIGYRCQ